MIGNVWAWTSDWYVPSHHREEAINPSGPSLLQVRRRGGTITVEGHKRRLLPLRLELLFPLSRDGAAAAGS
jgi:hypothetical protein